MQLIHGDCLEKMKDIPDKSIDMVLTDPPYGTTACKWDTIIPFDLMWAELNRVIKPKGCIALFGSEPFSSALRMSNIKNYKYDWIWNKSTKGGNFLHAPNMPLKNYENICIFSLSKIGHEIQLKENRMVYNPQGIRKSNAVIKRKANTTELGFHRESHKQTSGEGYACKNENYPTSILSFSNDFSRLYPTQKPVALLEYLIKTYTLEGETVLDFTMGSGSTGVACVNTKRDFIGIEKLPVEKDDKNYFGIAENRIKEAIEENELKLFK